MRNSDSSDEFLQEPAAPPTLESRHTIILHTYEAAFASSGSDHHTAQQQSHYTAPSRSHDRYLIPYT